MNHVVSAIVTTLDKAPAWSKSAALGATAATGTYAWLEKAGSIIGFATVVLAFFAALLLVVYRGVKLYRAWMEKGPTKFE